MRNKGKTIFSTTLLLCISLASFGQSEVFEYDYDDAGNRISRNVIYLRQAPEIAPQKLDTLEYLEDIAKLDGYEDRIGEEEDLINGETISIYPNPFLSNVNVKLTNTKAEVEEIRVYDLRGKVVYSGKNLSREFSIDLSNVSSGEYTIWIRTTDKVLRYKVIKS